MYDADINLKSLKYSAESQLKDQAGNGSSTQFDRMQGFVESLQGQINKMNSRVVDKTATLFGPSVRETVQTIRPEEMPALSPFSDGQVGQLASILYRLAIDLRDLELSTTELLSKLSA